MVRKNGLTERQWQRRYKALACVGALTLLIQLFELLSFYLTDRHAIVTAYVATPLLFCLGYGVQKLLLIGSDYDEMKMTFSYETEKQAVPTARRVWAMLISIGIAAVIGRLCIPFYTGLLGDESSRDVGGVLFMIACAVAAADGCLLQPRQFHQLISLRTAIEYLGAHTMLLILTASLPGGLFILSYLPCVVAYIICLCLLMNQEFIIKPAYMFEACHATDRIRKAGMRSVFAMLTLTLLLCPFMLCALSFLIITARLIILPPELAFNVPFSKLWNLNAALYAIGAVVTVIAIVIFAAMASRKAQTSFYGLIRRLIARIGRFLRAKFSWFLHVFHKEPSYFYPSEKAEKEQTPHYIDTVVFMPPDKATDTFENYRAFAKRLRRYGTDSEKYRFAYRVLVNELYAADIGIRRAQTPAEVAKTVEAKTNLRGFGRLTELFIYELYGQKQVVTPTDLDELCGMVAARLT